MYLFSMYVLFIKHNSPSTCQQWWTKILPTGYLWVPQQNRTNKETLQTGYSCCLLSQGWGGGLCQPCPHTCRQCSTDTAPRAAQSSPASLCKECFKHPDSWKPGKATVCNVLSMAAHIHVLLQAGATASLQSLDPCMAQHQPPAAVAGEMPAVPAPWEALGSRRGRGPGHACPTLAHRARAGIPSLTPHGLPSLLILHTTKHTLNPMHHCPVHWHWFYCSKNTVPSEPDGTFEWSQADIRWTSASGPRHLSFLWVFWLYWATLNSFLKGTGKERSENKWG